MIGLALTSMAQSCEWPALRSCFDGCGYERRYWVQIECLVEPNPLCEVCGSLKLVAKRAASDCDRVAEPDVVQPDFLARNVHHVAEHRTRSVNRHDEPGLFEELPSYRLLGMLAVVDTPTRQRPRTREVRASAGTSQQNAAVPYRDTVSRNSLPIDAH